MRFEVERRVFIEPVAVALDRFADAARVGRQQETCQMDIVGGEVELRAEARPLVPGGLRAGRRFALRHVTADSGRGCQQTEKPPALEVRFRHGPSIDQNRRRGHRLARQIKRRSAAQRLSSRRLESCSLRSTAEA